MSKYRFGTLSNCFLSSSGFVGGRYGHGVRRFWFFIGACGRGGGLKSVTRAANALGPLPSSMPLADHQSARLERRQIVSLLKTHNSPSSVGV
jgi:hypothetical protein